MSSKTEAQATEAARDAAWAEIESRDGGTSKEDIEAYAAAAGGAAAVAVCAAYGAAAAGPICAAIGAQVGKWAVAVGDAIYTEVLEPLFGGPSPHDKVAWSIAVEGMFFDANRAYHDTYYSVIALWNEAVPPTGDKAAQVAQRYRELSAMFRDLTRVGGKHALLVEPRKHDYFGIAPGKGLVYLDAPVVFGAAWTYPRSQADYDRALSGAREFRKSLSDAALLISTGLLAAGAAREAEKAARPKKRTPVAAVAAGGALGLVALVWFFRAR